MLETLDWVTWSATPAWFDLLGVVGFVIALVQLARSRSAIRAATEAFDSARRNIAGAQIHSAIPALSISSERLDEAISSADEKEIGRQLRYFSERAVELAELIRTMSPSESEAIELLRDAANDASSTQSGMYHPSAYTPHAIIRTAETIRGTALHLRGTAMRLQHVPAAKRSNWRRNRAT